MKQKRKVNIKWFRVFLISFRILFLTSKLFTFEVLETTVKLNPIENIIPVIVYKALAVLSPREKLGNNIDKMNVSTKHNIIM